VEYQVEFTEEFRAWYEDELTDGEQMSVARVVDMLEQAGPMLPFPFSSGITGSRYSHIKKADAIYERHLAELSED
jgi:hypothetical protein